MDVPTRIAICLLASIVLLTSCGPDRFDDPVAVMMDRSLGGSLRHRAAAQAEREMPGAPKRIAALRELVWQPGHPAEMRIYAIDQLMKREPTATRRFLNDRLPIIDDWETFEYIAKLILDGSWEDLTPGLIRRYAMTTPVFADADRPERRVLEQLHPNRSAESLIFSHFAGGSDLPIRNRAAAWQLLWRLEEPDVLRRRLLALKPIDPLIIDLQAAARQMHVLPNNMETVAWVQMLRTERYGPWWDAAANVVADLTDSQRQSLELRHLAMLVYLSQMDPPTLKQDRATLMQRIREIDRRQNHHLKGPTYDGPMTEHPQRLIDWQDELTWADAVTMLGVHRILSDRGIVAALFAQADADLNDESTEYGGLIRIDPSGNVVAQGYTAMIRRHDNIYYPPKQLVTDAYTALAHYHFHAQRYENDDWAGPGMGDLKTVANRQQFTGLVFTFVDHGRLNVDYYRRGDVVIDLGEIRR